LDKPQEKLVARTGNRDFDYALAQTLSRLTEVFRALPGFSFRRLRWRERVRDGRGQVAACRRHGPFRERDFISSMQGPANPEVGVMAICAHAYRAVQDQSLETVG
jgi:hypothetical protein